VVWGTNQLSQGFDDGYSYSIGPSHSFALQLDLFFYKPIEFEKNTGIGSTTTYFLYNDFDMRCTYGEAKGLAKE
jgi:hypothetical protein